MATRQVGNSIKASKKEWMEEQGQNERNQKSNTVVMGMEISRGFVWHTVYYCGGIGNMAGKAG